MVRSAWLAGFLMMAGCGGGVLRANLIVEAGANSNSPVMLSAVLVHSAKMLGKLQEMTAAQWFAKREQLLRDFPKELEETYWELVPGQQVPPVEQPVRKGAAQGILFAKYRTPGAHRYLFDPKRPQQWSCGLSEMKLAQ